MPKKQPQKPKKQAAKSEILIPLDVIKEAYVQGEGQLSVAARFAGIPVRRYKVYLYEHYAAEMQETIEEVIEIRADHFTTISSKLLKMIETKIDLAAEIMSVPASERKKENFEWLPFFTIREQQFLIFMMQIYAKHRGFSLVYKAQDFTVDTTTGDKLEPEERQIIQDGLKEVARYNPEIIGQLRVIQGGRK